ncbi:Myb-like DNA-binding domain containing protein [Histomonas meleagridis]|uniref:Myb-like DNA-binding domain containing protein n=1 Tax=Histomonas meleagridis TaxID=135588 RepID=UPI003559C412|nr:Myb-like DNA-binding domain containing protein [Histomonas meleagridis]KAH0805741.1 Myb-like DNA-binding domain containing protein [Histomonas meleagridis]
MSNPANLLLEKSFMAIAGNNPDPEKIKAEACEVITNYMAQIITPDDANARLEAITGTSDAVQRINEVLQQYQFPDPIPQNVYQTIPQIPGFRKRSNPWTEEEDERLKTAIHVHGSDNWSIIATFVGGGRTKSQCSQRWRRVLDPKINKSNWTKEEEEKLIEAVKSFGTKAWTRIASEMGNRSDVQCRFRYNFLQKKAALNRTDIIPIATLQADNIESSLQPENVQGEEQLESKE